MSRAIAAYERQEEREPDWRDAEIEHEPIDPELQTGESRKLGGAMRIRAPWLKP